MPIRRCRGAGRSRRDGPPAPTAPETSRTSSSSPWHPDITSLWVPRRFSIGKSDRANGPFHTLATFHQMKKLEHAEGYGLFMGGQALDGKGQKYTYFLVRDDGKYLIKRRDGEKTSE